MTLRGRLQENHFLELLQLASVSRATGMLDVRGARVRGTVRLEHGAVESAASTSTRPLLARLAGLPRDEYVGLRVRDAVHLSLLELAGLREGEYELGIRAGAEPFEGLDLSRLIIDPADRTMMTFDLARELSAHRRTTAALLESAEIVLPGEHRLLAGTPEAETAPSHQEASAVLLVDVPGDLVATLRGAVESDTRTVMAANSANDALEILRSRSETERIVPVVWLAPGDDASPRTVTPAALEEIRRSAAEDGQELIMVVGGRPDAELRMRELGVRRILPIPSPEQPDSVRELCESLGRELDAIRNAAGRASTDGRLNHAALSKFLDTMSERLVSPTNGVARMVLRVASRYAERVVLFLVHGHRVRGISGLHAGRDPGVVAEAARSIDFDVAEHLGISEVVRLRAPKTLTRTEAAPPTAFAAGNAPDYALLPLTQYHDVLAVVFCDNPSSGEPSGALEGLVLFLEQAGTAIEKGALHRRLRAFQQPFSLDDQGPLTPVFESTGPRGA